ncbi:S49 family peptidase [Pseudomonas sp.]|uniref:S49 family peptidase n=1 Tax=Pseudomonas sp. TaxID=306 RepID=UPI003FD73E55
MRPTIWAGSEAAYEVVRAFEEKFAMDPLAYASSLFDRNDNQVETDPVFGVDADRKGLTVLEMVGDKPVIKVHGSLVTTFSRYHSWFPGQVTSYEAINDALAIVREYGGTELMMDFASGGGHVRGVDGVTKMMGKVQKAGISIHGHTDSASMSASYWMMAGCDRITASRMAEVGSIGTMAVLKTYADTEKNMGVTFTVLKEGDFKAIGNPYEKLSDADKAYVQKGLKKANTFFLGHVALNRPVELEATDDWAEGKTFYADEAVKNGLVDQVIDLDDLIGSGASAQNPGDKRILGMKISAEKLAQIESGAKAEDVLTPAELKSYKADLQAMADAAAVELQAKADLEAAQKLIDDAAAEPTKPVAETGAGAMIAADYKQALLDNGKLTAKMEALAAQVVEATNKLAVAQAETESLAAVAKHAVSKLQIATGSAREEKSKPSEILAQFNDLQGKMAKMYPTSRQSEDAPAPVVEAEDPGTSLSNYRLKTQQLNQQKR